MRTCIAVAVAALGLAAAGPAAAQTSPGGPPEPDAAYPTELGARPLLLPDRLVEAQLRMFTFQYPEADGVSTFDVIGSTLSVHAGLGGIELQVDGGLVLRNELAIAGIEPSRLADLGVGVGVPVAPDQAVLARIGFPQPTDNDFKRQSLLLEYAVRRPITPTADVRLGAGLTFDHVDTGGLGSTASYFLDAIVRVGGRVQPTPMLGIEGGVLLHAPLVDDLDFHRESSGQAYARAVVTTPRVDAWLGFGSLPSAFAVRTYEVGVAGRLP